MNSTTLLSFFRAQVFDEVAPYLWSDAEIFAWMTDAQEMFCRLTQGISDSTTEDVVEVPVVTAEATAEVHSSILRFRKASLASTGAWLDIVNIDDVPKIDATPGKLYRMIIGMEPGVVRWEHVPAEDDTVNLLVFRLPLESITAVRQDFEIPERHHIHLIEWMKYMAYSKHDTETAQGPDAMKARQAFELYCVRVKQEQERLEYKPRVVVYGGI